MHLLIMDNFKTGYSNSMMGKRSRVMKVSKLTEKKAFIHNPWIK